MNTSSSLLMTTLLAECPGGQGHDAQGHGEAKGDGAEESKDQSDFGALVYIVVVLMFYSTGVLVMIVRYLKTEKKELEEEATLENFFKAMPDKKTEQEHRVNRVAIHAFHTLTSFSYEDDEDDYDVNDENNIDRFGSMGSRLPTPQPLLVTDL